MEDNSFSLNHALLSKSVDCPASCRDDKQTSGQRSGLGKGKVVTQRAKLKDSLRIP